MRRSALVTVAVLGGLVCLLGGTVLFSALQDTARTGTNSVESAALAASADLQLARATLSGTGNAISCGTFSEDLSSGLFTATGVSPGYQTSVDEFLCVKNVGSQQVTLSALADELVDVDFTCSGDEAAHSDATCGGDQAGELSIVLFVDYARLDCVTGSGPPSVRTVLKDNATTPAPLGTLGAGATGCFGIGIEYPLNTPVTAVQKAQTDRATWRFKFTGQA